MHKPGFKGTPFLLSLSAIFILSTPLARSAESEYGGWIKGDYDGVRLTYPATFKKTAIGSQGDDDTILKVNGTTDNAGGFAELALSRAQGELSQALRLKMIEEAYLSKLPDYKGQTDKQVPLPGRQSGLLKEVTFTHAGATYSQKLLLFGAGNKNYQLLMTCPLKSAQSAATVWNAAISNLALVTTNSATQTQNTGTNSWRSKSGALSLSYPATLKEEVVDSEDHQLKAASNEGGKIIGLDVYRGDKAPHQTTEELSSELEQKHFETQKAYQKLNEESRTVGSGIQALVRESTFETHGTKVHHLSAFIASDKELWAICLSTAGLNSNEAHQLWSRIASSISLKH
ncbi:MAG: DcrB-related protein [Candidatus Obscuribacter sp.]|nr:DcrB-related protein [Candidatus Obscuribacter sp.]MBP6592890.1 DcrB-related protein [Candidatus Obscuribacter sp.]MBP7578034.1 DcrB-related protein [Candidatus Obscuribacter sp.]